MRVVGIVPARGGSKRLPNKNLAVLGGKTLTARACEAGLDSGVLDALYVNTDSPEIALAATQAGAKCPALRPRHLAGDDASSHQANLWLLDVLAGRGESYDALVVLQPTSPLRTAQDVREAFTMFEANAPCAVKSVTVVTPENWLGRIGRGGQFEPLTGEDSIYRLNGAIYIHLLEDYRAGRTPRRLMAFPMPPGRSVDVDTLDDLRVAEALADEPALARQLA